MKNTQAGILQPLSKHSRYLSFHLRPDGVSKQSLHAAMQDLTKLVDGERTVVGIGASLLQALGVIIEGMRVFPAMSGPGFEIPSTPAALWCWLRGDDRGELYHASRQIEQRLRPVFELGQVLDGFMYSNSRDLSGYEDGTENPQGGDAIRVAIVAGQGPAMDGSSFVAVQQWQHDLDMLQDKSPAEQDDIIGRHRHDNEEFASAPASAHVKRAAQESFEPNAFILRRSTPWVEGTAAGLQFVAFGKSFTAFEQILKRMVGEEDGITDALFSFTRPLSGAYFWCPPMQKGKLNLSLLGV